MTMMTADICDELGDDVRVAESIFRSFGKKRRFSGAVCTLRAHDDNSLVRETLKTPGNGRVLVVDGGGSRRCALLGGNLAQLAIDNGWAGIVIYGCVRDRPEIDALPIGILALQTMPRKSEKQGRGEKDADLRFAGIAIRPGDYAYVDEDGLVLTDKAVHGAAAIGA